MTLIKWFNLLPGIFSSSLGQLQQATQGCVVSALDTLVVQTRACVSEQGLPSGAEKLSGSGESATGLPWA